MIPQPLVGVPVVMVPQAVPVAEPRVKFTDRLPTDKPWIYIFAALFLAYLVIGFVMVGGAKDLSSSYKACAQAHNLNPRDYDTSAGDGIFQLLKRYPQIFILALLCTMTLSVLWIYVLQKFARFVVWGTLLFKVVALVGWGIFLSSRTAPQAGIFAFVAAGILSLCLWFWRRRIDMAAELLRQAAHAIHQNIGMVGMSAILQVILCGLLGLAIWFLTSAYTNADYVWVRSQGSTDPTVGYCQLQTRSGVGFFLAFLGFMAGWSIMAVRAMRAYMIAGVTATWYFHSQDNDPLKPAKPSVAAFKWSVKAFGTNVVGGLILALAERLQAAGRRRGSLLGCLLRIAGNCLAFLSKFCLIFAAITGDSFMNSARRSSELLKRHFAGGYVANRVGANVLGLAAFFFALIVGFISWVSIDPVGAFDGSQTDVATPWNYFLYAISILLVIVPILGLFLVSMWPNVFFGSTLGYPFTFGLLCAIISHFLFDFMARVILDTVDAMFVCVAIDKDNNTMSPVGAEIHAAMLQMPEFRQMHPVAGDPQKPGVVQQQQPGVGYIAPMGQHSGGYSQVPTYTQVPMQYGAQPYGGQYLPPQVYYQQQHPGQGQPMMYGQPQQPQVGYNPK